jgi:repressor LexA
MKGMAIMVVDTFANRLQKAMNLKNMKQVDLVEKTNIDKSLISNYLKGKYKAKQDNLYLLAKILNVSEAWLMGYDVPMERNSEDILNKIGAIPILDIDVTNIPLLGTVKAGYDYLAQENIIDYISFKVDGTDKENYYALNVVGDSMTPLFDDGDTVIVHKQDDFENGDNCVVLINGEEATIKKVYKDNTGIELKAVNPYYPPRLFSKKDIKDLPVKIIGVVEKSIRNFKNK